MKYHLQSFADPVLCCIVPMYAGVTAGEGVMEKWCDRME